MNPLFQWQIANKTCCNCLTVLRSDAELRFKCYSYVNVMGLVWHHQSSWSYFHTHQVTSFMTTALERKKERKTCLTPTRPDVTGLDHVLYESFSINKPSPENKNSGFKKAPGRQNKQFTDGKHVSPRGDLTYRALPTPSVVLAKTALACPEHVTTCFQTIRTDGPELQPLT